MTNGATSLPRSAWPRVSAPLGEPADVRPGRAVVMAIVNRTPDSFFDQGAYLDDAAGLAAVDRAVEPKVPRSSTSAGSRRAPARSASRTRSYAGRWPSWPRYGAGTRTWSSASTRGARRWPSRPARPAPTSSTTPGQGADPGLAVVAAEHGAGLVCSHAGGLPPRTDPHRVAYDDVVADVVATVTGLGRTGRRGRRPTRGGAGRPGARLRQEHLPLARGHPAARRAGRDRLAGAGGRVEQEVPRRGARRRQGPPARGDARGDGAGRLAGRPGLPRPPGGSHPQGPRHGGGDRRDILVLVTTNEEVGSLNPAVARPGRCAASVAFTEFDPAEATEWLARNGAGAVNDAKTLAELFALSSGVELPARRRVGFA